MDKWMDGWMDIWQKGSTPKRQNNNFKFQSHKKKKTSLVRFRNPTNHQIFSLVIPQNSLVYQNI